MSTEKIKLSSKQKEVISLIRDGHPMLIGMSETSGRNYYMVASTKNGGFGNTYFNATVFSNLLSKGLIQQQLSHPFDWQLTELGETIKL